MRPLRVLVTGSSRGIGRETARALLEAGCDVVINGRDAAAFSRTREKLGAGRVHAVAADAIDPRSTGRLVEAMGGLDALVNNAGNSVRGALADLDAWVLGAVVRTHILGACLPTIVALPGLRASRGSVPFISSLAGMWEFPEVSIYAASKMALTAIAQNLEAEESGNGVHVGTLYVGFTENDEGKRILAADGSPVPITRGAHARQRDVARAVVCMLARRRRLRVLTPAGGALRALRLVAPGLLRQVPKLSGGAIRELSR